MQRCAGHLLAPGRGLDRPLGVSDLPLAGQKHQHRFRWAALLQPVVLEGPHHLLLEPFPLPRPLMLHRNRKAAPRAGDHGGPIQPGRQGGEIKGGGHHHDAQLRPQQGAGLAHQSKRQIRFGAPFVEFVEDHAGHPLQGGIGLQAPQEQAPGEDLEAGAT